MKKIIIFFLFISNFLWACSVSKIPPSQVDTLEVPSGSMSNTVKTIVALPTTYRKEQTEKRYPIIILLHGYSGNAGSWLKDAPDLVRLADTYQVIFVCPDGGYHSWWWDSPLMEKYRYETFISKELIEYIDKNYNTLPQREYRAILGLSMGGHGALYNAMRHQDVFSIVGSMCGGVDIRPFPNQWDMKKHLGKMEENKDRWLAHSVMGQLNLLKNSNLQIMIDCGTDDFFLDVNRKLHQALLTQKIAHDYTERPGGHNAAYWGKAALFQIHACYLWFKKEKNLLEKK